MDHVRWVAMNIPPVLASMAKDMPLLIVLQMMCMGVLCIVLEFLEESLLIM